MSLGLAIFVFVVYTALWMWLIVVARPWIKKRVERWVWHRLGGSGDPPS